MTTTILNRDFQHPNDGWYQIEPKGEHPNKASKVVQIIDNEAAASIVNRFNADAQAGKLRHGREMLIDHEHFADLPNQESRAYGWLQELQNREDGIYGRVRWTATGKTAVDGGDYRFFSTEYEPQDLKVVNGSGSLRRVRPVRLSGLSLTNMHNNIGQHPITNRAAAGLYCPACGSQTQKQADEKMKCPDCGKIYNKDFADAHAPADLTNQKQRTKMKSVCTLLGLSAEADEASVHAAVSKLINRGDISGADLTTLRNRETTLVTENKTLIDEQLTGLLEAHGVKEEKTVNRLKPVLAQLKNRQERVDFLIECNFKPAGADKGAAAKNGKVLNRADAGKGQETPADAQDEDAQKERANKIRNRASELQGGAPTRNYDSCWDQATREIDAKK